MASAAGIGAEMATPGGEVHLLLVMKWDIEGTGKCGLKLDVEVGWHSSGGEIA